MANKKWTVEGYECRTQAEYDAAVRDKRKIDRIRTTFDKNNLEEIKELLQELNAGTHQFESTVGRNFDDEIFDLLEQIEKQNKAGVKQKKSRNKVQNKKQSPTLEEYDDEFRAIVILELKKRERRHKILLIGLTMISILSLSYFVKYNMDTKKVESQMESLSELKNSKILMTNEGDQTNVAYSKSDKINKSILKKYETLYNKNKKLIGWLKIDDTIIDFPVMQTVNNEYYLDHNYNQEKDKNGSIFMDTNCDAMEPSTNLILYGHNMKSGNMFGAIHKYTEEEFYQKHMTIRFDTIYDEGVYQVMYVFRARVYSEEEIVFKYYQFIDALSPEEFASNMNEMSAISLYDTGITASYGDQLLTLSTCDYEEPNGRFVVVAKKVN